jgi:hypothetical protein
VPVRYAALVAKKEAAAKAEKEQAIAQRLMKIEARQIQYAATASLKATSPQLFAPTAPEHAGVIMFGNDDEPPFSLSIDEGRLDLSPAMPLKRAFKPDLTSQKDSVKQAVEELKLAGAKTVYFFYFDRRHLWQGPTSFQPRTERILVKSTTVVNPNYASAEAEMNAAKSEMDAAQQNYDIENRKANSGGYGTGAGALAGLGPGLVAANRLSKAQKRYYAARERFNGMSAETKNETWATAALGDMTYHIKLRFPLVMYACNVAIGVCAEKERVIEHEATAERPLIYYDAEPSAAVRKAQIVKARETLYAFESKLTFGFSVTALGEYFRGAKMVISIEKLADYTAYADKAETQVFDAEVAALSAKSKPIYATIKALSAQLPRNYKAGEVVATAVSEAEEEERSSTLQGLE